MAAPARPPAADIPAGTVADPVRIMIVTPLKLGGRRHEAGTVIAIAADLADALLSTGFVRVAPASS